jgi:hypothetical protein
VVEASGTAPESDEVPIKALYAVNRLCGGELFCQARQGFAETLGNVFPNCVVVDLLQAYKLLRAAAPRLDPFLRVVALYHVTAMWAIVFHFNHLIAGHTIR